MGFEVQATSLLLVCIPDERSILADGLDCSNIYIYIYQLTPTSPVLGYVGPSYIRKHPSYNLFQIASKAPKVLKLQALLYSPALSHHETKQDPAKGAIMFLKARIELSMFLFFKEAP